MGFGRSRPRILQAGGADCWTRYSTEAREGAIFNTCSFCCDVSHVSIYIVPLIAFRFMSTTYKGLYSPISRLQTGNALNSVAKGHAKCV